jgi:PPOX class probable F420-dependent enzyme
MPGYGILGPEEGSGLLPWSWAEERLGASHDYWAATSWPDGRPHVMPVWGVWDGEALWFSSSLRSRKARNIAANPRCVLTTDDAVQPVVVEGVADRMVEPADLQRFIDATNAKYSTEYGVDFLDPEVNATFRVKPSWVFALSDADFEGSPTRWRF